MDKRISLECRGKPPPAITELDLDNCRTTGEFEGLTEDFVNLQTLSVVQAGITTLKGFPKLPNLKTIDLSGNRISGGLQYLSHCENLASINLSSNKIKELDALQPLKSLNHLKSLEINQNDIVLPQTSAEPEEERRKLIFELLPNLTSVDGYDQEGNVLSDDDDENLPNGIDRLADDGEEDEDGDDEEGLEEEEEEDEDDEDELEGPGLAALYDDASALNDEEDGDYDEEAEVEDEDVEEEEEEEEGGEPQSTRGKKRKHEEEGEEV